MKPQIELAIDDVEIEAIATNRPPAIDLAAIRRRAERLDPRSQIAADVYAMLRHIEELQSK